MKLSELVKQLNKDDKIILSRLVYIQKTSGEMLEYGIVVDDVNVITEPTHGNYRVTNLYVDAATKKLVVKYDDTPAP